MAKKKTSKARRPARKAKPSPAQKRKKAWAERKLEVGLKETFPGSDAVAVTDPTQSIKE